MGPVAPSRSLVKEIVGHSSIPLRSQMVDQLAVRNIWLFGRMVYGLEVMIGVLLMLAIFNRWFALPGLSANTPFWRTDFRGVAKTTEGTA